jgi:ribosomal protein S18 acetylase RimI-like enzyme
MMTPPALTLRNASTADIAHMLDVQHLCYGDEFHEDAAAFAGKVAVTPETCWIAMRGDEALAYLVTLPVTRATLPALNASSFARAAMPQLLYVHDLAVAPSGRALGLGRQLMQQALAAATRLAIPQLGLVAVQESVTYWRRYGFAAMENRSLPAALLEKLRTFGENARYMEMPVRSDL